MKSLGHGRVSERRRNAGHRHPEPDARILLCKERPKSSRSAVADHESPQPLSVLLDATTVESGPTSGSTPMEEKLAPPSIQPFLAYAHQDADHFHHQLRIHLCPSDNGTDDFFPLFCCRLSLHRSSRIKPLLEVHVEALGHLFFDVLDVGDVSAGSWFLIPYCAQNRNWNASSRRIQN